MVNQLILSRLARGAVARIVVGTLEERVACAIGAHHTRNVTLSTASFLHIRGEHPDIELSEFEYLPLAIANGLAIFENSRPNCVILSYQSPIPAKRFLVPIKCVNKGTEIFVSSFHRGRNRQTRSLLRRGEAVRLHR